MKRLQARTFRRSIFLVCLLCFAFEAVMCAFAWRAQSRARRALPILETLRVGETDRRDVERAFATARIPLSEEACSSIGCDGLSFGLSNYPRFTVSERLDLDIIMARLSLIRPTDLTTDLYFQSGRLNDILINYRREDAGVRIVQRLGEEEQNTQSTWEGGREAKPTNIEVFDLENRGAPLGHLVKTLNLTCLRSIFACNTALELWPGAPPDTKTSIAK